MKLGRDLILPTACESTLSVSSRSSLRGHNGLIDRNIAEQESISLAMNRVKLIGASEPALPSRI